jgi:predicted nuclease of predicted toxin-antitoxin system
MARLYADENFPRPVVEALQQLGHDVRTTHKAGQSEQAIPDDAVLAFAHAEGRAVLTLNRRHFIQLHSRRVEHSGIIVCTLDTDFAGQAGRIDQAIASQGLLVGSLIRVNRPSC